MPTCADRCRRVPLAQLRLPSGPWLFRSACPLQTGKLPSTVCSTDGRWNITTRSQALRSERCIHAPKTSVLSGGDGQYRPAAESTTCHRHNPQLPLRLPHGIPRIRAEARPTPAPIEELEPLHKHERRKEQPTLAIETPAPAGDSAGNRGHRFLQSLQSGCRNAGTEPNSKVNMPKPQSGASLPLSRIRGSALLPRLGMTSGTPGIRIPYLSRLVSLVLVGRRGRHGEPEQLASAKPRRTCAQGRANGRHLS